MILGQALFQIVVALTLHFAGHQIFSFNSTDNGIRIDQDNELSSLIFNTFVFCQICELRRPCQHSLLTEADSSFSTQSICSMLAVWIVA